MKVDPTYSPDVEIDHDGRVVWVRVIGEGERVSIPLHMMGQIRRQSQQDA